MQRSVLRWTNGKHVHSSPLSGLPHVCMDDQTEAGSFVWCSFVVTDSVLSIAQVQQVAWLCAWLTAPLVSKFIVI